MASANHFCYMLLHLLLFIFLVNIHPCSSLDLQTEQRVQKICRQIEDFGFCYQTFTQNIKSQSADFVLMTLIALDQTTKNATNAHNIVVQLLSTVTDQPTRNALIACENAYNVVTLSFQDASADFNGRDYDSMLKSEDIAPRAQASCEISFVTPPSPADPLKEINRQMRILVAMAMVSGHELLGY